MIPEEKFRGRARYVSQTSLGSYPLGGGYKIFTLNATVAGVAYNLPTADKITAAQHADGGPVFVVFGASGTTDCELVAPISGSKFLVKAGSVIFVGYENDDAVIYSPTLSAPAIHHYQGLIVGGTNAGGSGVALSQQFSHPAETWTTRALPATTRSGGTATVRRDTAYHAGSAPTGTAIGTAIYATTRAGGWATLASAFSAQYEFPLAGAWQSNAFWWDGSGTAGGTRLAVVTGALSSISVPPASRPLGAGVSLPARDRVLLIGGDPKLTPPWLYHAPSDTYETVDFYSGTNRRWGTGSIQNQKAWYIGGQDYTSPAWVVEDAVDIFDPATRTWAAGDALPAPRTALGSIALGGSVYACGGRDAAAVAQTTVSKHNGSSWVSAANPLSAALSDISNAGGTNYA